MSTPKTYLDNLQGCKPCFAMRTPDNGCVYGYGVGKKSICYSFGYDDELRSKCHSVSFNPRRDGRWYEKTVLKDLIERFGEPAERYKHNGVEYYLWREWKEA